MSTRQRKATLQDIADIVGISRMSVSRILNGRQNTTPETAKRIQRAIEETGYRKNQAASNLKRGSVFTTIGLVVDHYGDDYFATVSNAVQEVAQREDSILVVTSSEGNPGTEADLIEGLLLRNVDGILLYPTANRRIPELRAGLDRPLVLLGRSSGEDAVDAVVADNVGGGRLAAEHLIAHGHERIGVLTFGPPGEESRFDDPNTTAGARITGYRAALRAAGLPDHADLIEFGGLTSDSAVEAMRRLLHRPDRPTAVIALNSRMSLGVLRACRGNLQGLALVGMDDFELADAFDPAITVVTQDPRAIGTHAAETLFERLAGRNGPPRRIVQPMRVIPRGSGETPPARS